jgi:hypothetical protein
VKKLGLETYEHPHQICKKCKIKFDINANFIDEVEVDGVPLDICGVVLNNQYTYREKSHFLKGREEVSPNQR